MMFQINIFNLIFLIGWHFSWNECTVAKRHRARSAIKKYRI